MCRLWHSIGLEFLYSSFLLRNRNSCRRLFDLVQSATIARCIKRVTLVLKEPQTFITKRVISFRSLDVCPNLTIFVDFHGYSSLPQPNEPVLNSRLSLLELPKSCQIYPFRTTFGALVVSLPACTSLQTLRLTEIWATDIESNQLDPFSLPHLEVLDLRFSEQPVGTRNIMTKWLPSLVLPKLKTLILDRISADDLIPVLQKFGSQLHTLGLDRTPRPYNLSSVLPTSRLRHVIARHDFAQSDWNRLPRVLEMATVEVFEMLLIDAVKYQELNDRDGPAYSNRFSALLALATDSQAMPSLKGVIVDLGYSNSSPLWPGVSIHLMKWVEQMKICRPDLQIGSKFYDAYNRAPKRIPLHMYLGLDLS